MSNKRIILGESSRVENRRWKGKHEEDTYSGSEESSDGENLQPDNPEFDMDFFRVLAALKMKHPILEKKDKFFKDSYQSNAKKGKEKPLTIENYQKKIIFERGGEYDEDDEDYNEAEEDYNEMQYLLPRENANNNVKKFKFNDNLSDDDDDDNLFSKEAEQVEKTEEVEEENEALNFMKDKATSLNDKLDEELLTGLKEEWKTKMSEKDKFLMDYFVNQRYLEDDEEGKERAPNHYILDVESLEEDEKTFNKMEEYETKYRFRFEEPDEEFIRSHPRVIRDCVRKKDIKRKQERDKKKEKQKEESEKKKQELMRLKATKRKEILERIDMLKEAAGLSNNCDFQNYDLDEDFDPEKHDAAMSKIFGDEYYGTEEDVPYCQDEELQKELEVEYEKLKELEYMPEGGFKYVNVCPNSYGLTTEEILRAKDAELNKWYSVKKMLQYNRSEENERFIAKSFQERASMEPVKRKILSSLFEEEEDQESKEAELQEKKRKKNQKKKERKLKKLNTMSTQITDIQDEKTSEKVQSEENVGKRKRKRKSKKKKSLNNEINQSQIETEQSLDANNSKLISSPTKAKKTKKLSPRKSSDSEFAVQKNEVVNQEKKISENNAKKNSVENKHPTPNGDSVNKKRKRKSSEQNLTENEVSHTKGNSKFEDLQNKKKRKIQDNRKYNDFTHHKSEKEIILDSISNARLVAYGQNPNRIQKFLKYSNRFN